MRALPHRPAAAGRCPPLPVSPQRRRRRAPPLVVATFRVKLASVSGISTPPMSFITCIIGGMRAGHALQEAAPCCSCRCRWPPFSQTTTLSNLMFEIAWADGLGQRVEVFEHQQLERLLGAAAGLDDLLQALALLGQDLVLAAGLGFELGEDGRGLALGLDAALLGLGLGLDDDLGLLGLGRGLDRGAASRPRRARPAARAALAMARFCASCTAASASRLRVSPSWYASACFTCKVGLRAGDLGLGLGLAGDRLGVGVGQRRCASSARRP